ncbi:MAG TPA: sensor histidine kinase [Steroidobacteraceae bacterium]|jgi:two-component system sensor histidine kinase UhpB|nr:sensor histidine kinase [Steroidobacteraceae bacterium]
MGVVRSMRRWRISLKARLMLLISVLIALFCVAAGTYIVKRAQSDIRGEVYSATDLVENYLDAQLKVAGDAWREDPAAEPNMRLERLRSVRHVEVYFYNGVGTLLESSAVDRTRESTAPPWFARMVEWSFKPIPDARRFVSFGSYAAGVLVVHPDPAFEIDEIWNVARGLLGLLMTFSLLVNAFVWWAVGRALRPLERVRAGIRELTAGNLEARLPPFELAELAGLSGEFNDMARALESSTLENRRLNRRLIEVQEEEREFLARELHDEIGQCVAAIHADAFTIRRSAGAADSVTQESATAIIEITAQLKSLVRGMLQKLRPAVIDRLGLEPALRDLHAGFAQRNPEVACEIHIDPRAAELKGNAAMAIFRTIQEGLTNVSQHAHARHVSIDVRGGDRLTILLTDDGRGFDSSRQSEGFGLIGMRERIAGLGGTLSIDSSAARGTVISMELPWPE